MTSTLNNGTLTFTPTLVDGYESTRQSANIVHQILHRSAPDVTLHPAAMRSGTLRIVFADGTMVGGLYQDADGNIAAYPPLTIGADLDSKNCEDAHAEGGVWTFSDTDVPTVGMNYVPSGGIRRTLDETRRVWILEVDFHEVDV